MSRLSVVGIGSGHPEQMTPEARRAIETSDLIVGYRLYVELVRDQFPEKEYFTTGMRGEKERVSYAVDRAMQGVSTVIICSGDAEVYGMAPLVFEIAELRGMNLREIRIVPGITAALSCGALLGSPLSCDFAVISLSDQLVPWERIEQRLDAAARGDLPMVLYNPGSRQRREHLRRACGVIGRYKAPETVCAVVRNAGREGQSYRILPLSSLPQETVDMVSTVFIGSADTRMLDDRMVTPRGYGNKYDLSAASVSGTESVKQTNLDDANAEKSTAEILIFGGTTEGRKLAETALEAGYRPTLSVASEYGRETAEKAGARFRILSGKMPEEAIRKELSGGSYICVIDATHPYAEHISDSILRASDSVGIRCLRLIRAIESDGERRLFFPDMTSVIAYLNDRDGRVFFATGSNAAQEYSKLDDLENRAFIRILPSEVALVKVKAAGFRSSHILCMQGPFSEEMNISCFRYADAEWLVTKSSGTEGGYDSKVSAAEKLGMKILVIRPPLPQENVDSYRYEEMTALLREKRL